MLRVHVHRSNSVADTESMTFPSPQVRETQRQKVVFIFCLKWGLKKKKRQAYFRQLCACQRGSLAPAASQGIEFCLINLFFSEFVSLPFHPPVLPYSPGCKTIGEERQGQIWQGTHPEKHRHASDCILWSGWPPWYHTFDQIIPQIPLG